MIKRLFLIVIFLYGIVFLGSICFASSDDILVSPGIIDRKVKARDIIEENISIKNNGNSQVFLYAVVSDILSNGDSISSTTAGIYDKERSVSAWTEITSGVTEIKAGQEAVIPLRLLINLAAKPGKYYEMIYFVNANDRFAAENLVKTTKQPGVMLNIEVEEHAVERAQLEYFNSTKNIFYSPHVDFSLSIKNIGNVDIIPKGDVHIYNRRGTEVASLPINDNQKLVSGQDKFIYKGAWKDGVKMGRYKAKLIAEYGERTQRDLGDDIFFWVLPWQMLLVFAGLVISLLVLTVAILKRKPHNQAGPVVQPMYRQVNNRKTNVINLKM